MSLQAVPKGFVCASVSKQNTWVCFNVGVSVRILMLVCIFSLLDSLPSISIYGMLMSASSLERGFDSGTVCVYALRMPMPGWLCVSIYVLHTCVWPHVASAHVCHCVWVVWVFGCSRFVCACVSEWWVVCVQSLRWVAAICFCLLYTCVCTYTHRQNSAEQSHFSNLYVWHIRAARVLKPGCTSAVPEHAFKSKIRLQTKPIISTLTACFCPPAWNSSPAAVSSHTLVSVFVRTLADATHLRATDSKCVHTNIHTYVGCPLISPLALFPIVFVYVFFCLTSFFHFHFWISSSHTCTGRSCTVTAPCCFIT